MFRLAAIWFISLPLLAQTTHLVGPGGFAQIRDALMVATTNDTILVQPGSYLPFLVDVSVRIVAPNGAQVIWPPAGGAWQSTAVRPPIGQTVYLSGLTFDQSGSLFPHVVYCTRGQAVFDRCAFSPTHPFKSFYTLQCFQADLVLVRCSFSSGRGAVKVENGSLSASDCTFYGVDPETTLPEMPAAMLVSDGRVQLSFCTLRGGDSWRIGQPAGPGMRITGNSEVSLVDCVVTGGDATSGAAAPPSTGLVNGSAQPVRHLRSSVVGGWSSIYTPIGSWPVRGAGIIGPEQATALVGLVGSTTGLQIGQPYGIAATAQPSTLLLYAYSFALTPPATVPLVLQPIRMDLQQAVILGAAVTGSFGVDSLLVTSSLAPAAVGTPVWFHAFALDGGAFQAATPVGGLVR